MRESIELHDSKLLAVSKTATGVCVKLDAYIHRSPERPGGPGTGWQQVVELQIDSGVVEALSNDFPWTIMDGEIIGSAEFDYLIPLPCEIAGDLCFEASGCNERTIKVRGSALRIVRIGEARYIEETPAAFYVNETAGE
jgi:hypothetical protein